MINLIFDIDDTLIIHPKGGSLDYNKISVNQKFNYLLDFFKYPKFIYTNATYGHADIVLNKLYNKNKFKKIFARDTIPYTYLFPFPMPAARAAAAAVADFLRSAEEVLFIRL